MAMGLQRNIRVKTTINIRPTFFINVGKGVGAKCQYASVGKSEWRGGLAGGAVVEQWPP